MNVKKNVVHILEDTWTSSNYLKENKINDTIDISDVFKKEYNFSREVPISPTKITLPRIKKKKKCIIEKSNFVMDKKYISSNVTSSLDSPIWVVINKKSQSNKKVNLIDEKTVQVPKEETTDTTLNLSNKSDLNINKELEILKSLEEPPVHNNISNIRNLPNILRGPKTLSKSNTSSPVSFETEENSFNTNNVLTNNILKHENNQNIKQNHHKRKQTHNPLLMQEESINLATDTEFSDSNESMKKNEFISKKTDKLTKSYKRKKSCKTKEFNFKTINNKISFSSTPTTKTAQDLDSNANLTTYTHEQTEEQTNDFNFSSELNLFYEDQFHEDYIDHIDILRDTLKENEITNDNSKHECYDINCNNFFNFNNMDSSVLQYEESQDCDFVEQKEYTWNDTNLVENGYLSDCEDSFLYNNNGCPMPTKDLENTYVSSSNHNMEKASICNLSDKNCLLSFFDDSWDNEFCLTNLSYNCQQNSDKDEVNNLDTLLLEGKKHEANLENHINNDPNSFKINVEDTNAINNTVEISLSNGLEDSSILRQDISKQESDRSNVLLNTDLSTEISSDYQEYTEKHNEILLKANPLLMKETRETKKDRRRNCIIKLNYKIQGKKHSLIEESDSCIATNSKLNNINKEQKVIEQFQCLLCKLTFTSKRTLAIHLAGAHGDMYLILCERCGRLFNRKCVFNRHFIHCGCIQLPFNCEKCNRTYRHKSSLLHHLKTAHQLENKQDTTKIYKCDICSKIYRKYRAFEKHLSIHILS